MSLKFYAVDDHCGSKAMSEFRALEERFDSLDDCCRIKFPLSVSDCCDAGEDGCLRSGHLKFIPVSTFLPRQIYFAMFATFNCFADYIWFFFLLFKEMARSSVLH